MLVLSRNVNEVIRIGQDIIVTIVGVHGRIVKVGIDAPKNIEVHRQEVFDKIQRLNRDSHRDVA